jgi:hypothetical protein
MSIDFGKGEATLTLDKDTSRYTSFAELASKQTTSFGQRLLARLWKEEETSVVAPVQG